MDGALESKKCAAPHTPPVFETVAGLKIACVFTATFPVWCGIPIRCARIGPKGVHRSDATRIPRARVIGTVPGRLTKRSASLCQHRLRSTSTTLLRAPHQALRCRPAERHRERPSIGTPAACACAHFTARTKDQLSRTANRQCNLLSSTLHTSGRERNGRGERGTEGEKI